jgi:hypothetical protein
MYPDPLVQRGETFVAVDLLELCRKLFERGTVLSLYNLAFGQVRENALDDRKQGGWLYDFSLGRPVSPGVFQEAFGLTTHSFVGLVIAQDGGWILIGRRCC